MFTDFLDFSDIEPLRVQAIICTIGWLASEIGRLLWKRLAVHASTLATQSLTQTKRCLSMLLQAHE